ncbi:MAG TPA: lytic transglycosylase domain-containing protein [Chitinophagaceae bacterium]|nr:lytic transglycosylase domain-containing protein [Chitinophagaceae bacterium]
MTIIKQISLLVIGNILLIRSADAGKSQQGLKAKPVFAIDTTLKKDSNQNIRIVNDPKQGFKDLFITATIGSGINVDQLNPLALNFVQDYMEKFGKKMESMKTWGRPYFDMMDGILTQHGLPKELKYLAVIESQLKSNVRSWAGAVGPWQFMPVTARNFGLRVSRYYDERTDYFKSTHAASRYLTDLFSIYGDWLLVIAAYNGGPGNVNYAIKKSGSRDFWTLQRYLPAESRNHVKKFIATHYLMEGQGGITTSTKNEAKNLILVTNSGKEEIADAKIEVISGRYNSLVIVKYITMDIAAFNKMNPDFDKLIADNGKYELRLPDDKMNTFLAKKIDILNESLQMLLKSVSNTNH